MHAFMHGTCITHWFDKAAHAILFCMHVLRAKVPMGMKVKVVSIPKRCLILINISLLAMDVIPLRRLIRMLKKK